MTTTTGNLDAGDLDLQAVEIASNLNNPKFDLTGDGKVDYDDRVYWVENPSVKNSWIGDANLDGVFDSNDFVQVFVAGEYEVEGTTAPGIKEIGTGICCSPAVTSSLRSPAAAMNWASEVRYLRCLNRPVCYYCWSEPSRSWDCVNARSPWT